MYIYIYVKYIIGPIFQRLFMSDNKTYYLTKNTTLLSPNAAHTSPASSFLLPIGSWTSHFMVPASRHSANY